MYQIRSPIQNLLNRFFEDVICLKSFKLNVCFFSIHEDADKNHPESDNFKSFVTSVGAFWHQWCEVARNWQKGRGKSLPIAVDG